MKKRWSVALLAVVLTALAIGLTSVYGAFTVEKFTAFTISGDEQMFTSKRVTDAALVQSLTDLLNGSAKASVPADRGEVARIQTENGAGAGTLYAVVSDETAMYVIFGNDCRSIDARAFYDLFNALGTDFYVSRPIPTATAAHGRAVRELTVTQSTYSYRRPDGQYYRTAFEAGGTAPSFSLGADGALPAIQVGSSPKSATLTVSLDGKVVFEKDLAKASEFKPVSGGTYRAEVKAVYDSPYYRGEVVWPLMLEYTLPTAFKVEGSTTYPGELVIIRAYNVPEGKTVTATTDLGFTPNFFSEGGGQYVALLPVSVFTSVGDHTLTLTCGDKVEAYAIKAQFKQFDIQHLTVSASTAEETINSQKANNEFSATVNPLRPISDNVQRWEGRFIMPVQGAKVTTPFGAIRYTNGSKEASVHGAVDLAAPTGTRISASNSGRVLYAGYLQLTGNTVIIEHGYGLKTWYYHMDSLAVSAGDLVVKGQKIGEVGSTGFSTGPHVHFLMTINNLAINPYSAIDTDLFAWGKSS